VARATAGFVFSRRSLEPVGMVVNTELDGGRSCVAGGRVVRVGVAGRGDSVHGANFWYSLCSLRDLICHFLLFLLSILNCKLYFW